MDATKTEELLALFNVTSSLHQTNTAAQNNNNNNILNETSSPNSGASFGAAVHYPSGQRTPDRFGESCRSSFFSFILTLSSSSSSSSGPLLQPDQRAPARPPPPGELHSTPRWRRRRRRRRFRQWRLLFDSLRGRWAPVRRHRRPHQGRPQPDGGAADAEQDAPFGPVEGGSD